MKTLVIATFSALAALAAQAEPIQLASLAAVDGKVLVNKGKGFVSAKAGMPLADGDRVIALEGSKAAVMYADGCTAQISENSLLALAKGAGCDAKPVKTGARIHMAAAIGGSATDAPKKPGPPSLPKFGTLVGANVWIPTAFAFFGAGMVGQSSDNRPISGQ